MLRICFSATIAEKREVYWVKITSGVIKSSVSGGSGDKTNTTPSGRNSGALALGKDSSTPANWRCNTQRYLVRLMLVCACVEDNILLHLSEEHGIVSGQVSRGRHCESVM